MPTELPLSPFADSVYARPGMTHQVRQFDRNPGRGETILTAVASPSDHAVQSENDSLTRARATGVAVPRNPRPNVYAHRDYYKEQQEATSIDRSYHG
jgi:hypothetical protein